MGNTRSSEHSSIDWLAKEPLRDHWCARGRRRPRRRRLRPSARQWAQAAVGAVVGSYCRGDSRLAAAEPNASRRGRPPAQP